MDNTTVEEFIVDLITEQNSEFNGIPDEPYFDSVGEIIFEMDDDY
jgi:hypothetical protein